MVCPVFSPRPHRPPARCSPAGHMRTSGTSVHRPLLITSRAPSDPPVAPSTLSPRFHAWRKQPETNRWESVGPVVRTWTHVTALVTPSRSVSRLRSPPRLVSPVAVVRKWQAKHRRVDDDSTSPHPSRVETRTLPRPGHPRFLAPITTMPHGAMLPACTPGDSDGFEASCTALSSRFVGPMTRRGGGRTSP